MRTVDLLGCAIGGAVGFLVFNPEKWVPSTSGFRFFVFICIIFAIYQLAKAVEIEVQERVRAEK